MEESPQENQPARSGTLKNNRHAQAPRNDAKPLAGEEWASGPWALLCGLTQYMKTLSEIAQHGQLRVRPDAVRRARNEQVVVDVFPASIYERLLLSGTSAEVWMEPSVSPENIGHQADIDQRKIPAGTQPPSDES